jgi:hypothetical protein
MYLLLIGIGLGLGLAACAGVPQNTVPTSIPPEQLPTVIAETAAAANLATPLENETAATQAPDELQRESQGDLPTHAPTVTLGLEPTNGVVVSIETPVTLEPDEGVVIPTVVLPDTNYPLSTLKIYRPGDLSRVISPFRVVANVLPGPNRQVMVELFGEDGRILVRKILEVTPLPGLNTANLVTDLEFETPGVAEAARLQFTVVDEFNRTIASNSVNLILLSSGNEELKGYGDLQNNIVIQQPAENADIQGGTMVISGVARTGSDKPLEIELIDETGRVVGFGTAALVEAKDSDYRVFTAEISYTVNQPTWVRVIVKFNGARIPGIAYISSLEVVVRP